MHHMICYSNNSYTQPKPIDVQVISHHMQRYAVWFGGSMLASTVSLLCSCDPCYHDYYHRTAGVLSGVSHKERL